VGSTISQARLNSVLLLHVHKELSPDIKSVIMAEFIGLNDTRRRIFADMAWIATAIWTLQLLLLFCKAIVIKLVIA
jgi:hypothetical protein